MEKKQKKIIKKMISSKKKICVISSSRAEYGLLKNLIIEHSEETNSLISKNIIENFEDEIKNFIQVCPKEMIEKIENPITLKAKIEQVS